MRESRSKSLLLVTLISFAATSAGGCSDGQAARVRPPFDGQAALELARIQLEFGPRVPGSQAHRDALIWMESHLEPLASVVRRQPFQAFNPHSEETVDASNLIASFYPQKRQRIMLCAHFDSRPVADHGTPPVDEPIDGAVDGAAGTAVLLQMARILAENEPTYGVDIVLFDAEDTGLTNAWPDYENWFQGSRYFSQVSKQTGYRPWFAVLVDLIGTPDAVYLKESFSVQYAPDVVDRVWDLAAQLGISRFEQSGSSALYDDHWVLNREGGIPAIDITMMTDQYPAWHTLDDTFEQLDAGSLADVGRVLVALLFPE